MSERTEIPREAVEAAARVMHSNFDNGTVLVRHLAREEAVEVLNAAAPLLLAAETDRLANELERRRAERDEIGDDDYDPDEDECDDAGDCHTAAAVATYTRVISLLSQRSAELRGA